MTPEQRDRLRLYRTDGVGPVAFRRLMGRFGSAATALAELPSLALAGGRREAPRIPGVTDAEREYRAVEKLGGWFLHADDADYPEALAALDDAPPVLMGLGARAALTRPALAIVGARNATANAQRIAETLASDLVGAGYVVVSGMARGIDAAAHAGALSAPPRAGTRGAVTIACVAGGLDCPYPSEHADLQNRIAANGCVMTESPLGTSPQARHFPRRNRVIAGLSAGVCVVEAALNSGSLITAGVATDAGREIFAVPGSPLDPRSRGSNDLLRQGATLTETVADILAVLRRAPRAISAERPGFAEPPPTFPPPPDERALRERLASLIGASPVLVDDLARRCQVPPGAIVAGLLELELAGRIVSLPGGRVATLPDAGARIGAA